MSGRLIIHATNVHQGGGRALLGKLLRVIPVSSRAFLLLDNRMPIPDDLADGLRLKQVEPTVSERFKAERWLANNVRADDLVLCFGNLPPLFKLRGHVVVFLQNRYLIDNVSLDSFSIKIRLRLSIERLWLSSRISNADEFIVQTVTMKSLLEAKTRGKVSVRVLPFIMELGGYGRKIVQAKMKKKRRNCEFLYVASGEPHKNHERTIEAWRLLAEEGLFPSLRLTLDEMVFSDLCREIEGMRQQYGLQVVNMGKLTHAEILALYKDVDALIFPSTLESFGLPLIEARQASLPVIASELDYVRDILDPEQSFDPYSSISIARAVKRFLEVDEFQLPLLDAKGFLDQLLGKIN